MVVKRPRTNGPNNNLFMEDINGNFNNQGNNQGNNQENNQENNANIYKLNDFYLQIPEAAFKLVEPVEQGDDTGLLHLKNSSAQRLRELTAEILPTWNLRINNAKSGGKFSKDDEWYDVDFLVTGYNEDASYNENVLKMWFEIKVQLDLDEHPYARFNNYHAQQLQSKVIEIFNRLIQDADHIGGRRTRKQRKTRRRAGNRKTRRNRKA
jgi:hypothetical protein